MRSALGRDPPGDTDNLEGHYIHPWWRSERLVASTARQALSPRNMRTSTKIGAGDRCGRVTRSSSEHLLRKLSQHHSAETESVPTRKAAHYGQAERPSDVGHCRIEHLGQDEPPFSLLATPGYGLRVGRVNVLSLVGFFTTSFCANCSNLRKCAQLDLRQRVGAGLLAKF